MTRAGLRKGFLRLTRPTTILVVGAIVIAFVTVTRPGSPTSRDARAGVGGAAPPNIVFVLTDDQTYKSVRRMPYTNERNDWFHFTRFFHNTPVCCPARATLLTGRYSHHTGVETNLGGENLDESSTLATWLDEAGYRTALIGKYLNLYPWDRGNYIPAGWDHWVAATVTEETTNFGYYDYRLNVNGETVDYGSEASDYSTDVLADEAVEFVAEAPEPFFLYLSVGSPHSPFEPAPRHDGSYADLPMWKAPNFNEADVSDKPSWYRNRSKIDAKVFLERKRRSYEMLLSVDEAIERLFDSLQTRGVSDNTVVVFTSDNGFSWGAHRWVPKACPYEECIRGPLLIRAPGSTPKKISSLTSNVDLAPTLADIAGATTGPVDGKSLVPLLERTRNKVRSGGVLLRMRNDGRRSSPPSFWGIRTSRYKYVRHATKERELYDLRKDPFELENVVRRRSYADVRARLAERLEVLRSKEPHQPE